MSVCFEEKFHKCLVTMAMMSPFGYWELSCPHYFVTYHGKASNPCDEKGNFW